MISAPAKIILVGEHAVVYGHPAIAIPVHSLRASAEIHRGEGSLRIIAEDTGETIHVQPHSQVGEHPLAYAAHLLLDHCGAQPPDTTIVLHSTIPIASGLGSGAAISTALVRSLAVVIDCPLSRDALNNLIYQAEALYHGTPSGIDNTVIVYEQPVFFVRGHPIQTIRIGATYHLLIADTGRPGLTRESVGAVRALYEADAEAITLILDRIGALVRHAQDAISTGDHQRLGDLMCQNHQLLRQLAVSSADLDRLVDAALDSGALGAKLSGGGRGGNMIALVQPEDEARVEDALIRAGAAHIIRTRLSASGG